MRRTNYIHNRRQLIVQNFRKSCTYHVVYSEEKHTTCKLITQLYTAALFRLCFKISKMS